MDMDAFNGQEEIWHPVAKYQIDNNTGDDKGCQKRKNNKTDNPFRRRRIDCLIKLRHRLSG